MSVATDLQSTIARISEALAGGKTYGRVDLNRLRIDLNTIREDATRLQDAAFTATTVATELTDALEAGAKETKQLARRARARLPQPVEAAA